MVRKVNDFVLSLLMIALSLFLIFGNVTVGGSSLSQGGILSQADTYLKFIAAILLVVSVILFFRSLDFRKTGEKEPFKFDLGILAVLTVLFLVIYTIALPIVGFEISTFVLAFLLCFSYSLKEDSISIRSGMKTLGPVIIRSLLFALVMFIALYLVFVKLLQVQLP